MINLLIVVTTAALLRKLNRWSRVKCVSEGDSALLSSPGDAGMSPGVLAWGGWGSRSLWGVLPSLPHFLPGCWKVLCGNPLAQQDYA